MSLEMFAITEKTMKKSHCNSSIFYTFCYSASIKRIKTSNNMKIISSQLRLLFLILLTSVFICGCGQSGALYLPKQEDQVNGTQLPTKTDQLPVAKEQNKEK